MARYPQAFIDEVRAAADIVVVVQDTVPLRRVGATYKGLCPFHGEKTPSSTSTASAGSSTASDAASGATSSSSSS